ncbi:E3 ubiquitin-protein ligase RLIM-like [Octodon degus]|uniref:E3 ubiquitin-protein ligase RLIM-like n=1 Tax=Octodon degus TaxID=10160 RepID=A0A6P3FYT4_OCTDE|nr:E3 ubiquitin-protein ligase RLIM-like [Octodon degus]
MAPADYCETVEITCAQETECISESEQRSDPAWTLGSQSKSGSKDTVRQNSDCQNLPHLRQLRGKHPQSELKLAYSSAPQGSTTEAVVENYVRTERSRSKRRRIHRATRAKSSSHPNILSEDVMRSPGNTFTEDFENLSVSNTETFSMNEPHKTLRQQKNRPMLQSIDNSSASGQSTDYQEHSPHTASNTGSEQFQTSFVYIFPDIQITIFPTEDPPSDGVDSLIVLIPETICNSEQPFLLEAVIVQVLHMYTCAEEARRSQVDTLRIPAFRNSNTGFNGRSSTETPTRTSGQGMTGCDGFSILTDTGSDLQYTGLPQGQATQNGELQNKREGSDINPSFELHCGATPIFNPSLSFITGSRSGLKLTASAHSNENPKIGSVMPEDLNERHASLGPQTQPQHESQHSHLEIFNETEALQILGDPFLSDESIFLPPPRLTKQQIDNLPVRIFDKTKAVEFCSMCLTEYTEGSVIRTLPCSHEFHVQCIDPWLLENSTCPI